MRRLVFVRDGGNWTIIDRDDSGRPIKQIFDFLHHPHGKVEYPDHSRLIEGKHSSMRVRDKKKQFSSPSPVRLDIRTISAI